LVFVDPDNGIEIPSIPIGHKNSSKYVAWAEIEGLWDIGCSPVIYQHFPRECREAFAERMESELRGRTGASFTAAIRTPHVLFLLAAQERHEPGLREAVSALPFRWTSQVEPMRLINKPLQPTANGSGLAAPLDGQGPTAEMSHDRLSGNDLQSRPTRPLR
jgi:hypothetical protein